jgi:CheY-like chemotaxis protein
VLDITDKVEYKFMAGEPILIVDDTPVNLKLTRILLANEGYKVQTAASAEEALELLAGYHPRLILADIQLPGMDGLEMTRRVKADEKTKDITVVALTAFAMKGDEQKAREAGCDGYITKPIDTRTLGNRIREYLDGQEQVGNGLPAPQPAAPAVVSESLPASEMNAVRRRFLTEGENGARRLLQSLDGAFHAGEAGRVVHQWVGTGGLLGYNAISRISRELQGLLAERPMDAAELRHSLSNLVFAFTCQREALDLPVPQPLIDTLSGKRIAMVGMPVNEAQRLAAALERALAKPLIYEFPLSPDGPPVEPCDLAVIYVRPGTAPWEWRNSLAGAMDQLPMVFVGRREDLSALDKTVQALATGILMDSWQAEEALVRISLALSPSRTVQAQAANGAEAPGSRLRVLIAGNDPTVVALARAAFENCGVDYQTASDGASALEAATCWLPDAMVLDVSIPGMDGYQVLSVIRAKGLPVRVLVLAARQQQGDLVGGATLGAGDFLFKPFSPMELVARLKRLTGR